MDKKVFYDAIRNDLTGRALTQTQVEGIERILRAWDDYGNADPRFLAYLLATSYHETAGRLQPVREGLASTDQGARDAVASLHRRGRISRNYALPHPVTKQSYYGRGDVQLTHYANYVKMGTLLDLPLATQPDLALDPYNSARILIEGTMRGVSTRGDFTGKALEQFIGPDHCDFLHARQTVNGMDKATLICGYAEIFLAALLEAGDSVEGVGVIIQLGHDGEVVRLWQNLLRRNGQSLQDDGEFGSMTQAATIALQRSKGLPTTGRVDGRTWGAIVPARPVVVRASDPAAITPVAGPPRAFADSSMGLWIGFGIVAASVAALGAAAYFGG